MRTLSADETQGLIGGQDPVYTPSYNAKCATASQCAAVPSTKQCSQYTNGMGGAALSCVRGDRSAYYFTSYNSQDCSGSAPNYICNTPSDQGDCIISYACESDNNGNCVQSKGPAHSVAQGPTDCVNGYAQPGKPPVSGG